MNKLKIKEGLLLILCIFITYRIVLTFWAIAVLLRYPINVEDWSSPTFSLYLRTFTHPDIFIPQIQEWLIWPWYRWDAEWYLRIAIDGYQKGGSTTFAPMYPLLIKLLGEVFGRNFIFAALVISNTSLLISCLLLFEEASIFFDSNTATRSVIYFLAFPTAFFLSGAYSESLFIMFVLLSWKFTRKNQWQWAWITVILSTMTRFQGIGVLLPFLYLWWRSPKPRSYWGLALPTALMVPIIWGGYLHYQLHLEFPWEALGDRWSQQASWPWIGILGNVQAILGVRAYETSLITVVLDLGITLTGIGLLIVMSKRLPVEYTLLSLALILPPLMKISSNGLLVSMSRYVISIWPIFFILAELGRKKLTHRLYIYSALSLQILISALFFLWYWIA